MSWLLCPVQAIALAKMFSSSNKTGQNFQPMVNGHDSRDYLTKLEYLLSGFT